MLKNSFHPNTCRNRITILDTKNKQPTVSRLLVAKKYYLRIPSLEIIER